MADRLLRAYPLQRLADRLARGQVEESEGEDLALVIEVAGEQRAAALEPEPRVGIPGRNEVLVALALAQPPDQDGDEHAVVFDQTAASPATAPPGIVPTFYSV